MTTAKQVSLLDGQKPDPSKSLKIRPEAASALFNVSKSTLQRWEKDMPGFPKPSRPTPRITLYDRDKLLEFFEQVSKQEPTA
jgi:hypothetical protein